MPKIGINIKSGTIKKDRVAGIDLGTTNSLIAFMDNEGKPYVLEDEGHLLVPSVLHLGAQEQLVGQSALPYLTSDAKNTIYSIKRFLGKSYDDIEANGFNYSVIDDGSENLVKIKANNKFYSPIELSALILKELKEKAESKLNEPIGKAVITVPAYFNDSQRQATRDAGKLAGLEVLRIINEPTAASLAYGLSQDNQDKTIAVYDLGGGTFDVSILRIEDSIYEVLSTHGNTQLGGDDFDQAIINYWLTELEDLKDYFASNSKDKLRLKAKEAKEHLSNNTEYNSAFTIQEQIFKLELNRSALDQILSPLINSTIEACKLAIKDSEINIREIDEVVMVGGSTRVKLVQEKVKELFHYSNYNDTLNPDEVVALGAAVEADILSGNRKDMVLLDVTPLSLGIEMVGGLMDVIVPRNSSIPTKVAKEYTTSVDGQVNLKVTIYQGERELVKDNRKLASFTLKGIPAMPAGFPKIKISFLVNADGILKVTAMEERSNTVTEVDIEPSYGLTDAQVEQMLVSSIENAEDDFTQRQNAEVINEAEQLIYLTKRFLDNNKQILSDLEVTETNKLVNNLSELLQKNEKRDTINKAIEALNNYTKPFAERAMDTTVKNALHGKKI